MSRRRFRGRAVALVVGERWRGGIDGRGVQSRARIISFHFVDFLFSCHLFLPHLSSVSLGHATGEQVSREKREGFGKGDLGRTEEQEEEAGSCTFFALSHALLACGMDRYIFTYRTSLMCVPLGCLVSDGRWGGVCVYLKRGWCCVAWACSAPQREWWLSMRQRNGLVRVSFGSGTTPVEIAGMALSAPPRLGWAGPLQVSSDVCVAVID